MFAPDGGANTVAGITVEGTAGDNLIHLFAVGELDKNVDPIEGTEAWEADLQEAGNPDSRVVLIPGAAHTLASARTGCLNEGWSSQLAPEYLEILEDWLQQLPQ